MSIVAAEVMVGAANGDGSSLTRPPNGDGHLKVGNKSGKL